MVYVFLHYLEILWASCVWMFVFISPGEESFQHLFLQISFLLLSLSLLILGPQECECWFVCQHPTSYLTYLYSSEFFFLFATLTGWVPLPCFQVHWSFSVLFILLLDASSIFSSSVIVFFSSDFYLVLFEYFYILAEIFTLLIILFILVIIFADTILNSLSGKSLMSISLRSVFGVLCCSFVINIFLCFFISFVSLFSLTQSVLVFVP